jgi:lipid-binding SYLF domain-containing protein
MAAGVGVGPQIGLQITDIIFVLNNKTAVKAFTHGNFTLGGNISVAAGPTGRSAEASGCNIF